MVPMVPSRSEADILKSKYQVELMEAMLMSLVAYGAAYVTNGLFQSP